MCGGVIDGGLEEPATLRDAFYRISASIPPEYAMILAEDAKPLTAEAGYRDLFSFESDIAQLVGLILIFAESPGSLAELGAFAALQTVSPSILAVLDDFYYNQISFIRNGPLLYLENTHGEEWIIVLERAEIGISDSGELENFNSKALHASIAPVIEKRLLAKSRWSKFVTENSGHAILLMTGLCQEFGALTISEIKQYLKYFGLEEPRLDNFIYCATLLGWIRKVRKGHRIFYVATQGEPAIDYAIEGNGRPHDKIRWRSDVRAHWAKNDPTRLRAISEIRAAEEGAS